VTTDTSILSYGTAQTLPSASGISGVCYDPINNVVVAIYGNGAAGTAIVAGSVSGTVITFGTPVTIAASNAGNTQKVIYSSTAGKIIACYANNTTYATNAYIVTVTGTTISLSSPTLITGFNPTSTNKYH
jgi:hypothetical protein